MTGRLSLVEQKKLQWAKEREEMARLCGQWGSLKNCDPVRTTIRTYRTGTRMSLTETNGKQSQRGQYGSTISLKSLSMGNTGNSTVSLQTLNCPNGSLISLNDQTEFSKTARRRSPSLPPIHSKDQVQYLSQEQRELGVEGLRFYPQQQQQQHQRYQERDTSQINIRERYGSPREEREGETSGYASDSAEAALPQSNNGLLPGCKPTVMTESNWNSGNYYGTPESSLPPSRRLSAAKGGELNRPRWGGIWGQDLIRGDPPPPSWLERGLSRLDHTSQVLVINHDSASSPDSSTTGSAGSDSNKTYLRGQNIPVDADILQEREIKRQKALELQNAIKQQLEERDRQRKAEKERRLKEEREEEARIKRERDLEKERFEEEQRRSKEKENAKMKKAEAMREVLEAAERLAKEEKKLRRKRDESSDDNGKEININVYEPSKDNRLNKSSCSKNIDHPVQQNNYCCDNSMKENKQMNNQRECSNLDREKEKNPDKRDPDEPNQPTSIQLPVSKDVAIVLSGRLDDPEILKTANLQLVNLVVTPSPRNIENGANTLATGLTALVQSLGSPAGRKSSLKLGTSPRIVENRILTPSKYRTFNGRDFGTQTEANQDLQVLQDNTNKEVSIKERKEAVNANRRDVEKSTNTGPAEEMSMKNLTRSKSQPRPSLESRPRWNANRFF
ncbi:DNA ligase 1 isoform X2 [Cephus cinctus]|uniref:DNA ligase 1 isoform X2 n=1 Tax=Cephus cinctus TaxID=211228 RepID=A0AAJ7BQ83_CEPCN|nr:DNA ligase 1 isoform X2 [Cephus cinctus]